MSPSRVPPGGSLLLCVQGRAGQAGRPRRPRPSGRRSRPRDRSRSRPLAPNVLTLDYCDLTLDGKTEKDLYFYDAQRKTFQAHGLDRNPWDSAVQYKTNILDLDKFPADSGFEAVVLVPGGQGRRPGFRGPQGRRRAAGALPRLRQRQGGPGRARRMVARQGLRRLPGGRPGSSPAGTRSRSRPGRSRSTASSSRSISWGISADAGRSRLRDRTRRPPLRPGPGRPRAGRSTAPGSATPRRSSFPQDSVRVPPIASSSARGSGPRPRSLSAARRSARPPSPPMRST